MPLFRPAAIRFGMLAALIACLGVTEVQAGKALKWKFKPGEKLNYALVRKESNNINAGGVEFEIQMKQIMDLNWNVKSVAADGTAEIAQTIDRIQLKMNTPFTGDFAYDSKSEEEPEGQIWQMLGPFMEGMVGQEFTMKVAPNGEVSDITLPEKLVTVIKEQAEGGEGGGGGGRSMMMGGGFSESMIKELISRAVTRLPAGSDDKWVQEIKTEMGPLGTQVTAVEYAYTGPEKFSNEEFPAIAKLGKNLEKIGVATKISMEAAEEEGDLDIEMELTEQEGSGTVYFDADAGRAVFSKLEQKMTMEGDFMGNEFVRDNTAEVVMVMGTSDDLPKEPEPAPAADAAEGDEKPADSK
jgi:hypothetical protein